MAREEVTIIKTIKDPATKEVLMVCYSDGTFRVDGGRSSYPHLDKPWAKPSKEQPNPKKVYSMITLLPKKKYRPVKDHLVEHNKDLMTELKIDFVKEENKYLRDGDKSGKPEAAGCYILSAREDRKPFTRGVKNENLSEAEALTIIYPGAVVSTLFRPWAQKDYGGRLNNGLVGVRALGGGERIGEGGYDDEDIADRFAGAEANGGFEDDDEELEEL